MSDTSARASSGEEEHFRPTGTIFVLAAFVAVMILLWVSLYLILVSRGVTQ